MLSPMKPKTHVEITGELLPQHQCDCVRWTKLSPRLSLWASRENWRWDPDKSESFDPHDLAEFLTRCLVVFHDAFDSARRSTTPSGPVARGSRVYGRQRSVDYSEGFIFRQVIVIDGHNFPTGGWNRSTGTR
jgi:hypothetical protein